MKKLYKIFVANYEMICGICSSRVARVWEGRERLSGALNDRPAARHLGKLLGPAQRRAGQREKAASYLAGPVGTGSWGEGPINLSKEVYILRKR